MSVRCWGWIMWRCSKDLGMKVLVLVYVRLYIFKLRTHRLGFYGVFVFAGSSLEDSVIRWCCISYAEQKKCEQ